MEKPPLSNFKIARVETKDFRNSQIDDRDFSGQHLEHLRFFDCLFSNCSFDGAHCRDLRMWSTTIRNCTFRKTDLCDSALGGVLEGRVNRFEGVDFSGADMRGTGHGPTVFTDCLFDHTKLNKVDFQGSRFTRCRFRGELREVQFYDRGFQGEAYEANSMDNVDFSEARLRWVEFRRLNLQRVVLPSDKDHIIVRDYPAFIDHALERLQPEASETDRILAGYFQFRKKWLPSGLAIGLINRLDFLELKQGQEIVARLDSLLKNFV